VIPVRRVRVTLPIVMRAGEWLQGVQLADANDDVLDPTTGDAVIANTVSVTTSG
jgi:hypothetical protein